MFDTIIGSFDHRPNKEEIKEARMIAVDIFGKQYIPNITTDEAFSLSKQMTTGQKMDLFVLDLSFLGWYFLGFLCFGIGALFVQPYDVAAFTEVYLILKESVKKDECATDIQSDQK